MAFMNQDIFVFNTMTILLSSLITFLCFVTYQYSARYLCGDRKQRAVQFQIVLLGISSILLVAANHFAILLVFWCLTNYLLIRLMVHKPNWQAARSSGNLALISLGLSTFFLTVAFVLFYINHGNDNIRELNHFQPTQLVTKISIFCVVCAAIAQSALWPMHRWLLSSANAPTPVSAIMHAGVINGGGILLTKFAPLLLANHQLLTVIFLFGFTSALLGTAFTLVQTDIKRYLACSTMSQMGFMFVQCGLGLFPAAVAHICYHGLFKAYLFLAIGDLSQSRQQTTQMTEGKASRIAILIGGLLGGACFAFVSGRDLLVIDSSLVLMVITIISSMQVMSVLLRHTAKLASLTVTLLFATVYGSNVRFMEWALSGEQLSQPQAMNIWYLLGIVCMIAVSIVQLTRLSFIHDKLESVRDVLFVKLLNASQPHPKTITVHRRQYQYQ